MKEQNSLKKAEEKKRREAQKLKRRRQSNTSTAMNTQRTHETNNKTMHTEKSEAKGQEQDAIFKGRKGLFSPNHVITREDAIAQFDHASIDFSSLPNVLKENNIKADHLLFKEAQVQYLKRKKELEKQIVIDNVHFVTQQ